MALPVVFSCGTFCNITSLSRVSTEEIAIGAYLKRNIVEVMTYITVLHMYCAVQAMCFLKI